MCHTIPFRLIALLTRFRFRFFHYGDQGIFVRKSIFDGSGGFREIPIMEDIDFLQRMRKTGLVTLIGDPVTTSTRRFLRNGIIRQQLFDIILVTLYLLGVTPEKLSKLYRLTDCCVMNRHEHLTLREHDQNELK